MNKWKYTSIALATLILTACGGGEDASSSIQVESLIASGDTQLSLEQPLLTPEIQAIEVKPLHRLIPVGDPDSASGVNSSTLSSEGSNVVSKAAPYAITPKVVTTYNPSQIRAAYAFPSLGTGPYTAQQAAQLGAGQTVYIINAKHNPNIVSELNEFNKKFGLPNCTVRTIVPNQALPLTAPSANACDFSVVYATASGTMSSTAPAYDAGWASEIALDVQWVHATAPLARIVLIEAPDASIGSLGGAIQLANKMGQGVVSMSFGATEGSWTSSLESLFTAPGMTYLAAAGDSGNQVSWPAVSPNVLAVGGTSLTWNGATRSETAWTMSGGGVSLYTPSPTYQKATTLPGLVTKSTRQVTDIAMNADPYTGQYVVQIPPGSTTPQWISAGGTSLSTPQWAGITASANAVRKLSSKATLGAYHATLYANASTSAYNQMLLDVASGANGTCVGCTSAPGYDIPTGLGTPNVTGLLAKLNDSVSTPVAPVVSSSTISGKEGTALSFTISASGTNLLYTLTGAPVGMTIATNGVVSWNKPVAGTYTVTVTAKDSTTNLMGSGVYTIKIDPLTITAPVVIGQNISSRTGALLTFSATVNSVNPIAYSLSGAPNGMQISSTGLVTWAVPILGTYKVTVTAKDTKTGLSGSGVYNVSIVNAGPIINYSGFTGTAGTTMTGSITFMDATSNVLSVSISGIPLGMMVSSSGWTLNMKWPTPVAGTYTMRVLVKDGNGLQASKDIPIVIK